MDNSDIQIIGGTHGKPQRKAIEALFGLDNPPPLPPAEGVQKVPVAELHTFPNHPFTVREDADMEALIESIRENGVLMPLLVRVDPKSGYQIIAGHRRTHAARTVGLTEVPAIIEELTDEEATIQMVDSNLHRERILPSEKARAYKMRLDAMKRKAGRPSKGNSSQVGTHLRSDAELAEQVGESRNQVQRYIRLNHLIPPLLDMVDAGELPLVAAVELSYCNKGWQEYELDMYQHDTKPTIERAQTARNLSERDKDGKDLKSVSTIVFEERAKKEQERREKEEAIQRGEWRKPRRITLSEDDLSPFFSELIPAKQVKANLLHMLATGQQADGDQWYENGASHANIPIVVTRDPADPYELFCPMCGADLHGGPRTYYARQGHIETNPINFCWVCGQRLDWGEAGTE